MRAFTFPGQGSQAPGMGKDLAEAFAAARAVFEEVDDALKQKLSKLMFEGPAEELMLTANAQPALMAHSIAVLRVLESEAKLDFGKHVSFVAGHSLGEYSALAAAGTFSLSDAARLLRLRGPSDASRRARGRGCYGGPAGPRCARRRKKSPPKRVKARKAKTRFATSPTTTRPVRSSCRVPKPPSNAHSISPRRRVPSAQCCCRYPPRSIVR